MITREYNLRYLILRLSLFRIVTLVIFDLEVIIMINMIDIKKKIQYLNFESIDIMMKFMHKWYMMSVIELTSIYWFSINKVELSMRSVDPGMKWEVLICYVEYTR